MSIFSPELMKELVQREVTKEDQQKRFAPTPKESPKTPSAMGPKTAMLLGGLADVTSTYSFLKNGGTEANPAFKYFNNKPWSVLPTSMAVGAGYLGLHKLLSKISPKAADTAAGLLGGYQMALGGSNMENSPESSYDAVNRDLSLNRK